MKSRKQAINLISDDDPFAESNKLQSAQATAAQLGLCTRTLQDMRRKGDGPEYVRVGARRVMYRQGAIDKYVWTRTYRHTAEEAMRHG